MLKRIMVSVLLVLCACTGVCVAEKDSYWEQVGEYGDYEIWNDRNNNSKYATVLDIYKYNAELYSYKTTIFTWSNKTEQKTKYRLKMRVLVENGSQRTLGAYITIEGKWRGKGAVEWEKMPYEKKEYQVEIPSLEYEIARSTVRMYFKKGERHME